ncbi:uncharacterized protein CC84DRAFT_66006 [Paraphaeosphaeria sporulosa]|uniref:Uncharacterized protein n=1 Tax=Paraphaeosphaeria sporulosa TaxID=1460663 RepID=A0A177CXY2_9PLEO|nr:uncharacterized protein CC84DRAFT_66006 [Paraphaeosphaeria sporulosa]OAG12076.1 hypothetical protein CC84DRAFT_66006 [Paraphaeosphaeria sporulosa]
MQLVLSDARRCIILKLAWTCSSGSSSLTVGLLANIYGHLSDADVPYCIPEGRRSRSIFRASFTSLRQLLPGCCVCFIPQHP